MKISRLLAWVSLTIISFIALTVLCIFQPAPTDICIKEVIYDPVTESNSFPPDLNTAGIPALMRLPGVGIKTAEAIAAYRTEYGPFHDPKELILVSGIGEKKLSDILACYREAEAIS